MIESSPKRSIIIQFFAWHFAEVPKALLNGFGNLLVFNLQFFSIGALLATLFSHWRRFKDSYGRGFSPSRYAKVFIANTFSRLIGAIIRLVIIVLGLVVEVLILVLGVVIFLLWVFLPFILLFGLWQALLLFI